MFKTLKLYLLVAITWPVLQSFIINSTNVPTSTHDMANRTIKLIKSNNREKNDTDQYTDFKIKEYLKKNYIANIQLSEIFATNRLKRNIPVLEPVRHLLNHVRDGHLNHTIHQNHQNHYHHLLKQTDMTTIKNNDTSPVIETEVQREMINESPDLKFLEFIGSIGSRLFELLTNFQQVFAASSGPLVAASSNGGSN